MEFAIRGDTALHFAAAAKCNAEHICKLLIDGGADPRISDKFGNFAYERAQNEDLRLLLGGPNPQLFEYARQGQVSWR